MAIIGITAYANKQADVLRKMAKMYIDDWHHLLKTVPFDIRWLADYECPPEDDKRNRLTSNVERYHPASYIPENQPCDGGDDDDAAVEVDYYPDDEIPETFQNALNDLL